MSTVPEDSATALAWDAERVIAALRAKPAYEFTVGELIWLVNMSQQVAWVADAAAQAEATRLLAKVSGAGES